MNILKYKTNKDRGTAKALSADKTRKTIIVEVPRYDSATGAFLGRDQYEVSLSTIVDRRQKLQNELADLQEIIADYEKITKTKL